jgi:hypothetical protein
MKTTAVISIALLTAVSAVAWSSQAPAQRGGRDAAISRCIAKAQGRYPRAGRYGTMTNRTYTYRACMHAAGYPP